MNNTEHQEQLAFILERAAESVGDVVPIIINNFFAKFPEAEAIFKEHDHNDSVKMAAEMANEALYCLMRWFERPEEIEIMLLDTVPHHQDLNIPMKYFTGLQECALSVIERTIPDTETLSKSVINILRERLLSVIENATEATRQ
jgi:hemoglobin-like flavoprotein